MQESTHIKSLKPLGTKAYGSIPHLPGSRLGPGDHHCEAGQARICLEKTRDNNDIVICQEKLDGSNVCVARDKDGRLHVLVRAGYTAGSSPYEQHHRWQTWAYDNIERFDKILKSGERLCGEWLAQAHGTRYNLPHEPFVAFDIIRQIPNQIAKRLPWYEMENRLAGTGFITPKILHWDNCAFPIEKAIKAIQISGHGAIDPVEGVVYRVERKRNRQDEVDFLAKYVRHDKEDGKYLPEKNDGKIIWNPY